METTRIGVVGTGDIGRMHARSLARVPGVQVVLAEGLHPERARSLASELGVTTSPGYEALLRDPSISGVTVCVPNDLHAPMVLAALEAGKAVLCEKPLALTLDEALAMTEASHRAGCALAVGHVLRFWPEYSMARDLMRQDILGTVQSFSARRLVPLLRAVQGAEGWRHQGERSGGAVLDLQIHDIDFILWTFGMPTAVTSRGVRSHTGAFDHVHTLLEYDHGPLISVESSFMLQGNPVTMDFRAIGTEGSLAFSYVESDFAMHDIHTEAGETMRDQPPSLLLYRWGAPAKVLARQPSDPIASIFDAELAAFVAMVRGEPHGLPSLQDAVNALRVVLASRDSCSTGETIRLA